MSSDTDLAFPAETIIRALRSSAGVVTVAAQKLQVSRATLHRWINDDPELRSAVLEIREEMLDLAESKMFQLIKNGDRESVRFYLRCFGKQRGWIDTPPRIEIDRNGIMTIEDAATEFDSKFAGLLAPPRGGETSQRS